MSIEDLNEKLKAIKAGRNPAAVEPEAIDVDGYIPASNQEKVEEIFPTPQANKVDPNRPSMPAASWSAEKVVGAKDPDYSGFDDLIKNIPKPRDTSWYDLAAMGISTGIGAMYGQVGTGASVAGKFGAERAKASEQREDDFQKQLMALRLARANQMAKGVKGTKVKAGGGSANWRAQVRIGEDGRQYWMTNVDPETGVFVPSESDIAISGVSAKTVDFKKPDGSVGQKMVGGNMQKTVGAQNAQTKVVEDAEGNKMAFNERTQRLSDLGTDFNRTSMNLTKGDQKDYDTLRDKKVADTDLKKIKGSYDDIVTGATALGRGDIGNMKVALKMLASALEKGRMTSDADLRQVSDMNTGLIDYFNKRLDAVSNGDVGIEEVRKEMESAYATIQATGRDAYNRRLQTYNEELNRAIPNRRDLNWSDKEVPEFGSKKQSKLLNESIQTSRDLVSTGERVDYFRDPQTGNIVYENGRPVRAKFIRDPQTKEWIAVERVN